MLITKTQEGIFILFFETTLLNSHTVKVIKNNLNSTSSTIPP